jgi:hypothetical protein
MVLARVVETAGFEVIDLPDGPKVSDEELDEMVLAWVLEQPEKSSTTKVREAMSVRAERVNAALERLKTSKRLLDVDRNDVPHDGRPRTPRYWIPGPEAGSEVVRTTGTTSDDLSSGGIERGSPAPESSRRPAYRRDDYGTGRPRDNTSRYDVEPVNTPPLPVVGESWRDLLDDETLGEHDR